MCSVTYAYSQFNILTPINSHPFIQNTNFSQELTIGDKDTHYRGTPNNAEKTAL